MVNKSLLVSSFIDPDAWNAAGWNATAFLTPSNSAPGMVLIFRDAGAAGQIFDGLRERLGDTDRYEELQVSIIEGPIEGREPGYTVYIGSNIRNVSARFVEAGIQVPRKARMVSLHRRMAPGPGSQQLANFKRAFRQHRRYVLLPAVSDPEGGGAEILEQRDILKQEVSFLQADQLTPKHPEWVVLGK